MKEEGRCLNKSSVILARTWYLQSTSSAEGHQVGKKGPVESDL